MKTNNQITKSPSIYTRLFLVPITGTLLFQSRPTTMNFFEKSMSHSNHNRKTVHDVGRSAPGLGRCRIDRMVLVGVSGTLKLSESRRCGVWHKDVSHWEALSTALSQSLEVEGVSTVKCWPALRWSITAAIGCNVAGDSDSAIGPRDAPMQSESELADLEGGCRIVGIPGDEHTREGTCWMSVCSMVVAKRQACNACFWDAYPTTDAGNYSQCKELAVYLTTVGYCSVCINGYCMYMLCRIRHSTMSGDLNCRELARFVVAWAQARTWVESHQPLIYNRPCWWAGHPR